MKLVKVEKIPNDLMNLIDRGVSCYISLNNIFCQATYIFTDKDGRDKILTGVISRRSHVCLSDLATGDALMTSWGMGVALAGEQLGVKLPLIKTPDIYLRSKLPRHGDRGDAYYSIYDIREIDKGIVKAIFCDRSPLQYDREKVFSYGFTGDFEIIPTPNDDDNEENKNHEVS